MEWRGEVEEGRCLGKCTVSRLCLGLGSLDVQPVRRLDKVVVVVIVVVVVVVVLGGEEEEEEPSV